MGLATLAAIPRGSPSTDKITMSRVFATGSADGIGLETVRQLLAAGHEAVGHARDARRAEDLRTAAPGVREVVVGDLTSLAETKAPAPHGSST